GTGNQDREIIMYIESIELLNFRNYSELSLQLDQGTNIIYGNNAQGKTNILEAIYVCGTTKSHRGSKDRELLRFGEEEAHIRMFVRRQQVPYKIDMHLKKNKSKGIAIRSEEHTSELQSRFDLVCRLLLE